MNYIGSKYSLVDFLYNSITDVLRANGETRPPNRMIFADLMSGTGVVCSLFKKNGYSVIANDIQYYSYVITKHLIENGGNLDPNRCSELINELNGIEGVEGFIYNNYCYEGTRNQQFQRMYFTEYNAKKCDAIRIAIENKHTEKTVSDGEYFFLLGSLINSIDKYANTASVYGAYLKNFKGSALKKMVLEPLPVIHSQTECKVYNRDINELIKHVSGDVLYLDPPYNSRQYCTNYHLLETIARYDTPVIHGKTGLREYSGQKSVFCLKNKVEKAFDELIKNAEFRYIFLSYNNEGLMSCEAVQKIMEKYGAYKLFTQPYRRFKADSAREAKADKTDEYLHCLIKY